MDICRLMICPDAGTLERGEVVAHGRGFEEGSYRRLSATSLSGFTDPSRKKLRLSTIEQTDLIWFSTIACGYGLSNTRIGSLAALLIALDNFIDRNLLPGRKLASVFIRQAS